MTQLNSRYKYSDRSKLYLLTCCEPIQQVFNEVIKHFDCTILCGHRTEVDQERVFHDSRSKVRWPNSRHNKLPSDAIDAVPYPVDWMDRDRFHYFAGHVMAVAKSFGIPLIWGGDWNSNTQVKDNKFDDLPHYEIRLIGKSGMVRA